MSTQKKSSVKKDTSIENKMKSKNDEYQKSFHPRSAISKREAEPYVLEDDSEEEKKEPECTMINTCDNDNDVDMDFDIGSPEDKKRKGNKKDDEKDSTYDSENNDDSEESDPEPEWLEKVLTKKDEIDVEKEESI